MKPVRSENVRSEQTQPTNIMIDTISFSDSRTGDNVHLLGTRNAECVPSSKLFVNFLLFSLFYSITHATVDAVLAFSSAELGGNVGSNAGFTLYIFYTLSAFLFAKPVLGLLGPKHSVIVGLTGLLTYVGCFFLALIFSSASLGIFVTGAAIGGCGAGVLWTAQGTYYSLNADQYSQQQVVDKPTTLTNFAAIFAAFYLTFEAGFKLLATAIYLLAKSSNSENSWRIAVFGMYTAAAFLSVIAFYFFTMTLFDIKSDSSAGLVVDSSHGELIENALRSAMEGGDKSANNSRGTVNISGTSPETTAVSQSTSSSTCAPSTGEREHNNLFSTNKLTWAEAKHDMMAVGRAIFTNKKLCYMIPYQICFGLASGFIVTYVNGVVVTDNIGDGYIGMLSGIAIVVAVLCAGPYAYISNRFKLGKWIIMLFGGLCFSYAGIAVLAMPNSQLAKWQNIIPYFIIHGAARGVWENTNKSVIADLFPDPETRDTAFATVYFSSGLAGAVGFLLYQFMSGNEMATLNICVSFLAIVAYNVATIIDSRDTGIRSNSRSDSVQ